MTTKHLTVLLLIPMLLAGCGSTSLTSKLKTHTEDVGEEIVDLVDSDVTATVAVIPFTSDEASLSLAEVYSNQLISFLVKSGKFNIVDRNQLTAVADEQLLMSSAASSGQNEVGTRFEESESIISGSVKKVGSGYVVVTSWLRAKDGKLLYKNVSEIRE
ncbi:MAG: hypothetical protein LCH54_12160 [Bacteroidetes bacterium]|nr:hypothetical protein [Bacteroidota bacterium]